MHFIRKYIYLLLLFAGVNVLAITPAKEVPARPISFQENKGQVSDQFYKPRKDILFSGTTGELVFHLKKNGISYQLNRVDSWKEEENHHPLQKDKTKVPDQSTVYRLDINWLNANEHAAILKTKELPGFDNFYMEVCPNGVTGVKSYGEITYQQIYKGIDLKWYEKAGNLKYDYQVSPDNDYRQIQLEINGADKIYTNNKGELIIKTPLGEIIEQAPYVTQNGKQLQAKWLIKNNIVSFDIKDVDPTQVLIIDPLIRLWGTYYGGISQDEIWHTICDVSNNVYTTGNTRSNSTINIASIGGYQATYGGPGSTGWPGDAFLAKFNSNGVRQWATYYGGSGAEMGNQCAIDIVSGDVYIVGQTTSTNSAVMSTLGAHQTVYAGGTSYGDGYVARFNISGLRVWGTYYGGAGEEWLVGLSSDGAGNIFISGESTSTIGTGIATLGSHQFTNGGGMDAFLAKFNSVGARQWGTYYGGMDYDNAITCNVDVNGNVCIVGHTNSMASIATPNSHQALFGGGQQNDGFIAKFNPSGVLLWGTYYGGAGDDWMYNCVYDSFGNIYVAGSSTTPSVNIISTVGSHQPTFGGGWDCFLVKFNSSGQRQWATYYGGVGVDHTGFCSIDPSGNVYLTGQTVTSSGTSIATPCTYQLNNGGSMDAFVAKFTPGGTRLWGSFYGGSGMEDWIVSACDSQGNVYIAGRTVSTSSVIMTTPGSHQPAYGGGSWDGFLVKFDGCIPALPPNTTPPPNMKLCYGDSTALSTSFTCGINWYNAPNGSVIGTNSILPTPTLGVNSTFYIQDISCGPGGSLTAVNVTVNALPSISINTTDTIACSGNSVLLNAGGGTSYTWMPVASNSSSIAITPSVTSSYSLIGFDGNCINTSSISITAVPYPTLALTYQDNPACYASTLNISASGAQSYSWFPVNGFSSSNGAAVSTTTLLSGASYTVVGSNTLGAISCSVSSSFSIGVLPQLVPSISSSAAICAGDKITLLASGGNTYFWSGENIDNPTQQGIIAAPSVSGIYTAAVSFDYVCPAKATVFIKVNPRPYVFAGNDTTINVGDPAFIRATGTGTLQWISGENIVCSECMSSAVNPFTKSCYVVQVTDFNSCKAQDEVCIEIIKDYNVYIPNSFTPNGDGVNDIFYLYGFGIKKATLAIYNRWGDKLYSSSDFAEGWNGFFKGKVCEQGVYVYRLEYTPFKGKADIIAGHVSIIAGD